MRLGSLILTMIHCVDATADVQWPDVDPYAVSLSGEIRVHVKYDSDCKQTHPDVIDSVMVAAEEVVTIAQPRRMLNRIDDPDIVIDNREPYRDYVVTLEYLSEGYIIQKTRLPAYHSPALVQFEFDCKGLKNQIWDARRQRSAERDKKKAEKEAAAKAEKQAQHSQPQQAEDQTSQAKDKAAASEVKK